MNKTAARNEGQNGIDLPPVSFQEDVIAVAKAFFTSLPMKAFYL